MSFFKPTRNADFLRSRTLFFGTNYHVRLVAQHANILIFLVVAIVLHLIWAIVAVLDVSSTDTRRTASHGQRCFHEPFRLRHIHMLIVPTFF